MTEKRARVSPEEWAKRVERWKDSGLTAPEFARELGNNAGTLTYWKHALKKAAGQTRAKAVQSKAPSAKAAKRVKSTSKPAFVRVDATDATPRADERFLLELPAGGRLHIPPGFDAAALRRLMSVLEGA